MDKHDVLTVNNRPNRAKHSYTQSINGTPEQVFPLLCPVREYDWVPDWETTWVISGSGIAEKDCMFQTPAPDGASAASIWVISRHNSATFEVEMFKVTPEHTVGKLEISLFADGDTGTRAQISYQFTSLGPAGDEFLKEFTAQWYEGFMRGWEDAMNRYLKSGKTLNEAQ